MKDWWKSKTFWFNTISLVLGVLGAIVGLLTTPIAVICVSGFIGLGNAILRIWFTDTGIASPAIREAKRMAAEADASSGTTP
jgi:hypothetical protein